MKLKKEHIYMGLGFFALVAMGKKKAPPVDQVQPAEQPPTQLNLPITTPPVEEPDLSDEKAEQAFNEGEILYKAKEYEEARLKYQEAFDLSGEPELLFDIGQCYRRLGQNDKAREQYNAFLALKPSEEDVAYTEEILEAMK